MTKLSTTVYLAESQSPDAEKHLSTLYSRPWPVWLITTLSALLLSVAYNHAFYHGLSSHLHAARTTSLICFSLLLFLLNHLLISLLSGRRTLKAWLITLFLLAALSSYFMGRYGVVIDREMLQNAIETDIHEVSGLYDIHLLWHLLVYFVLPAVIVAKINIRWSTWWQGRTIAWFSLVAISVLLIVAMLASQYQLFSSVFRNYREVKHLATPFNTLDAVGSCSSSFQWRESRPGSEGEIAYTRFCTLYDASRVVGFCVVGCTHGWTCTGSTSVKPRSSMGGHCLAFEQRNGGTLLL